MSKYTETVKANVQGINRVLLENLLPAHVATHFLSIMKGRPEIYICMKNTIFKIILVTNNSIIG